MEVIIAVMLIVAAVAFAYAAWRAADLAIRAIGVGLCLWVLVSVIRALQATG